MSRLALVRRCLDVLAIIAALLFFVSPVHHVYPEDWWDSFVSGLRYGWWKFAIDRLPQYEIPWGQVGLAAVALVGLVWGAVRFARQVGGADTVAWATAGRVTALAVVLLIAGIALLGATLQGAWLTGHREADEAEYRSVASVAAHFTTDAVVSSDEIRRDAARFVSRPMHTEWDGVPRELHIVCVDGPRGTDVLLVPVDPAREFVWIAPSTRTRRLVPRHRLREVLRDIEAGREPPKGEP